MGGVGETAIGRSALAVACRLNPRSYPGDRPETGSLWWYRIAMPFRVAGSERGGYPGVPWMSPDLDMI